MNQPTEPSERQRKSALMRVGVIAVIITALAVIVISVLAIVNPGGTETPNDETDTIVTLTDSGVTPSVVQVRPGASVTWMNESSTSMQLVATTPESGMALEGFGSDEAFAEGESYSFTFDKEGTFTYEDRRSPEKINGTIIVQQD